MYFPRDRRTRTASRKGSAPAATSAEYSPRECPAAQAGRTPVSAARTRKAATLTVKIAGCVFSVIRSSSSVPRKQRAAMSRDSASDASSKVRRATGYAS